MNFAAVRIVSNQHTNSKKNDRNISSYAMDVLLSASATENGASNRCATIDSRSPKANGCVSRFKFDNCEYEKKINNIKYNGKEHTFEEKNFFNRSSDKPIRSFLPIVGDAFNFNNDVK